MKLLKIILAILLCALQTLIAHKPVQPPVDPPTVTTTVPQTEPTTEPSTEPTTEPPSEPPTDPFLDRFYLTWSDEFDGDALDRTKWGGHYFNFNSTYYKRLAGYWNVGMARVGDGVLRIPSIYYPEGFRSGPPGYYSLGMDTRGIFEQKFGYFEARCILPKGEGLWSAFWLNCQGMANVDGSGQDGMEIDIYESPYWPTDDKNRVSHALHYDGYGDATKSRGLGSTHFSDSPYDNFHTYGLEWNTNEFIFYVDRVQTKRSTFGGVSQVPEFVILSVEHAFSGWTGDIRNNTLNGFEMTDFVVDYVRVYQYK